MSIAVHEMQGVLRPLQPVADTIYASHGVVRVEDLDWPHFDPERVLTMAEYIGEIGARLAEHPRESAVQDSALHVYRDDLARAWPAHLKKGLYFSASSRQRRPKKLVVRVTDKRYPNNTGRPHGEAVPFSTGVAVPEAIYGEIVQNAPYFSNRIAIKTEAANEANPIVEQVEDLGGESVLYALSDRHVQLEERHEALRTQRANLIAVARSLEDGAKPRRIKHLEPYRLAASVAIQTMVRVACRGHRYGTNLTQNTLNAVASNMYRSPQAAGWFQAYTALAINYNDAVRSKIDQSIHAIIGEIGIHAEYAINNIDREYVDKSKA